MHIKPYGATSAAMAKLCMYLFFLSALSAGKNAVPAETIFIPVCLDPSSEVLNI